MQGAKILRVPPHHHTTKTSLTVVCPTPSMYQVQVHASCLCNELRGLARRHLVNRHAGTDLTQSLYAKQKARAFAQVLAVKVEKMRFRDIIRCYVGRKRRSYEKAYLSLQEPHEYRKWATIRSFVKPDKYSAESVWEKEPRMIQYRYPEFNLLLAQFLKPYEELYYQRVDWTGQRIIAKGSNNLQRADNIVSCSRMFNDPVYVLCDHSKFDAHVTVDMLKFIHNVYLQTFNDKFLRMLLRFQLKNRGYTKNGVKYVVNGTRMSGDYDTALGNTLLNHYILSSVFAGRKHHLYIDGDDSVIILERHELAMKPVDWSLFNDFGMTTKYEVVNSLNKVEFCRSRLLVSSGIPRFARDPFRALSNMSVALRDYHGKDAWKRYMAGVGVGELAVSNGVPILGPIASRLSLLHSKPILDSDYGFKGVHEYILGIDPAVRAEFAEVYGVTPHEQILLERSFSTPQFNFGLPDINNVQEYEASPAGR